MLPRSRVLLASLLLAAIADSGFAQEAAWSRTRPFGSLFEKASFGDLALSYREVASPGEARELTILSPDVPVAFARNRVHECWAFLAHRRLDPDGRAETRPMYAGLQILSLYGNHKDHGAVFVHRNDRWVSRTNGTKLDELPATRVIVASLDQFAKAHSDNAALARIQIERGRLLDDWHAKVPTDDSADAAGRGFWKKNPIGTKILPDAFSALIEQGANILVENRLLKFMPTDSKDPRSAPSFNFSCRHPQLKAVTFRVFLSRTYTSERERAFHVDFRTK